VGRPTLRRLLAASLSMLLPGGGQIYARQPARGLTLLGVFLTLVVTVAVGAAVLSTSIDDRLLAFVLFADAALVLVRLFAVVDAWRLVPGVVTASSAVGLAALVALTAAPHVAAAYVAVRSYDVLSTVAGDQEPADVLPARGLFLVRARPTAPPLPPPPEPEPDDPPPVSKPVAASRHVVAAPAAAERPWTTFLLLGTDEGPGNVGERTDTVILAALEHGTGRAALFGIPRNLVDLPLGAAATAELGRYREPLNGLYGFARTQPELFPGGRDPGATALKQTVSLLLGIRVDYYALVDLRGFADLVDAVGPVRVRVKERLVDEVTRPAWGEPKPRIDVQPGRTYLMYGREALAYVRSRKDSDDYTRMARQRCFLSAMAAQFDPLRALRRFRKLASTIERNVSTDVPLDQLPDVLRLVGAVDPARTLTMTFGPEYFFGRRAVDEHPAPHMGRMRAAVRTVLLEPNTRDPDTVATAASTC
jgi:LCP family protein required for cell wall assembly